MPAAIVLQHHERIDGAGYPAGLRGDEIRIESRIIHAADAYVAMTRDRPYRKAMTRDDAFAELARHAGTQFDPERRLRPRLRRTRPPTVASAFRAPGIGPRTRAYAGGTAGATAA